MAKATYFNPVTGEKREIEIEDTPVQEYIPGPTTEERIQTLEQELTDLKSQLGI